MLPHGGNGKKITVLDFYPGKEGKWEKVTDKAGLAKK